MASLSVLTRQDVLFYFWCQYMVPPICPTSSELIHTAIISIGTSTNINYQYTTLKQSGERTQVVQLPYSPATSFGKECSRLQQWTPYTCAYGWTLNHMVSQHSLISWRLSPVFIFNHSTPPPPSLSRNYSALSTHTDMRTGMHINRLCWWSISLSVQGFNLRLGQFMLWNMNEVRLGVPIEREV